MVSVPPLRGRLGGGWMAVCRVIIIVPRRYVKNRVKTIFFILVKIIFKWFLGLFRFFHYICQRKQDKAFEQTLCLKRLL